MEESTTLTARMQTRTRTHILRSRPRLHTGVGVSGVGIEG